MIYCDSLSLASAMVAARWGRELGLREIFVLDALRRTPAQAAARLLLQIQGFHVIEAVFFAGHVLDEFGESVYLAARRMTGPLCFSLAEETLRQRPVLAELNTNFARNTLLLHIAKSLALPVERMIAQLMLARELARASDSTARVIMRHRREFNSTPVARSVPVETRFYGSPDAGLRRLYAVGRRVLLELARRARFFLRRVRVAQALQDEPALLAVQEDDMGVDRSYRLQPHWLFPGTEPPFRTFVIERNSGARIEPDRKALQQQRVTLIPRSALVAAKSSASELGQTLRRARRQVLSEVFRARDSAHVHAAMTLWTLFGRAGELESLARGLGVRVFLTGEPYVIESDAMQIVAPSLGIRTIAYQYSNLPFSHPVMMTTADTMVLFSPRFESLWRNTFCAPGAFVTGGYPYDSSFKEVRGRAGETRRILADAGATFVLCYFDESVQTDRYGLISDNGHKAELRQLLRLVLEDESIGMVVKTQFERNSPSRLLMNEPLFAAAAKTGRYRELAVGKHRNVVFPAEAAMAADLVIGHAVGATAALEAALTGSRCILLNPYGLRNLDLYGSQIVFTSLDHARPAIDAYRTGSAIHQKLGDWTSILSQFDPFRDGLAADRLRALLASEVDGRAFVVGKGPALETAKDAESLTR